MSFAEADRYVESVSAGLRKPLSAACRGVLLAVCCHGRWPGAWVWRSRSGTERACESLAKLGLLVRREDSEVERITGCRYVYTLPASASADTQSVGEGSDPQPR